MSKKTLGGILVLVVISLMLWSSLKEPGIQDLKVKFTELDFVRNENNTGPVIRRYLVTISDTVWSDLLRYGDLMPYSKLGSTEVYFFMKGSQVPEQVTLTGPPFPAQFTSALVAHYKKNTMGQVSLLKEWSKR